MIEVTLTEHDMKYATAIACARQISALLRNQDKKPGLPGKHGIKNEEVGWSVHCDGCLAEAAVAKHLNVWWNGALGDFKAADVGGNIQVRSTPWSNGCLILHRDDNDEQPFILVLTHKAPTYLLAGWIRGREGKQEKFWTSKTYKKESRPAYFVPQDKLNGMSTLFAK